MIINISQAMNCKYMTDLEYQAEMLKFLFRTHLHS